MAGDRDATDTAMHRSQGKNADRVESLLPEKLNHERESGLPLERGNHQGLLAIIDPLREALAGRNVGRRHRLLLVTKFPGLPYDLVRSLVVLGNRDAVKLDDPMQFGRHRT